jgi:hypothetical protein
MALEFGFSPNLNVCTPYTVSDVQCNKCTTVLTERVQISKKIITCYIELKEIIS